MINVGLKNVIVGVNLMDFKRGIDKVVKKVIVDLYE